MPISGVLSNSGGLADYQFGRREPRKPVRPSKPPDTFASEIEPAPTPLEDAEAYRNFPLAEPETADDAYTDYGLPEDLAELIKAAAKPQVR